MIGRADGQARVLLSKSGTWLLRVALLVAAFYCSAPAQDNSGSLQTASARPEDDGALRKLASEYYLTYSRKDLEGFLSLWSQKSPGFASRKDEVEESFRASKEIEKKRITVRSLIIGGDEAQARVDIESEADGPAIAPRRTSRSLRFIREGGVWRVW